MPDSASAPPDPPPPLTAGRLVSRALRLKCCVCGGGGIFHRWFTMEENCPTCGFRFERIEGHWIGSLGLNTILTMGAGLIIVSGGYALMHPDPNLPLLIGILLVVGIAGPLFLFPYTRTLWTAADLMMRPLEVDDGVDPDFIPARRPPRPRPQAR